ncbi:pseudouridine synthase [Neptunomonas japonica]|uniref:Dual-specificity RNA pseudouridine synthase RluF n=1 Tax=Neptunomonas japonica JAMM 1380 TaxID=1441457 RepID=A0A7R6PU56_9GAMM|nr:pseudouridine synthase [Neptunomonas japonica]BBB29533.1 16S rRNA pseudouridine516 synthase [Neptunomonas japonica JAMM 1380]
MRLTQFLVHAGVCSRRAAIKMIADGHVSIDGQVAVHPSTVTGDEEIIAGGEKATLPTQCCYVIYNKPVGIDCNCVADNPHSIINHVTLPTRLFPVGRIDKDSHGLMLLTNDGVLCQRLLSPDYSHPKTYLVTVEPHYQQPDIGDDFQQKMSQGIQLDNVLTRPCKLTLLSKNRFKITLTQGLNRQIRRMTRSLGYKVVDLQRVSIMNLSLQGLPLNQLRELTNEEAHELKTRLASPQ